MADTKISALAAAAALAGTEAVPIVQSAATVKTTVQAIRDRAPTSAAAATEGGTGQSVYTVGDILYASTTTALSKLPAGTINYVLTSGGAGVAPSWAAAAGGTWSGGVVGTPTTSDANADNLFAASAVGKKPLVLQTKASNTASVFQTQYSDGTLMGIDIQRDGNVVIDQKFGNVASKPLQIKYQTNEKAYIDYTGLGSFNGGMTVGGFWTVSAAGDVLARDSTARHLLGTGTSPTVDGSNTIAGKDTASKVTVVGTPSSIVITFGTAYATAPVVHAIGTTSGALSASSSTTAVTLTRIGGGNFTATEVLHVVCIGF